VLAFAFAATLAVIAVEWMPRRSLASGSRPVLSACRRPSSAPSLGLMLAYFLFAWPHRDAELLSLRLHVGLCCLLWFGMWWCESQTYFGLWLSLLGSLAIATAAVGEASLRGHLPPRTAFFRLLICRVELLDLADPRCRSCGYLLHGLTEPRCPECGRQFAKTPKQQG
jgi:hypothetical protein